MVLFNTLPNVSKFPSFTSAIPLVTVNVTCFYLVGTTRAVALIPTGFDGIWKLNQARERREKVRGERKRMTTTTTRRFFFSTSRSFVHHHYRTTARARILLQFCLFFSVFFGHIFVSIMRGQNAACDDAHILIKSRRGRAREEEIHARAEMIHR